MSCREHQSRFLEHGMDSEVERHAQTCASCSVEIDQLASWREVLGEDSVWTEPPSGLGDQIVAAIAPSGSRRRGSARRWMAAAAVVALLAAVGAFAALRDTAPAPNWEVTLVGEGIAEGGSAIVSAFEYPLGTELHIVPIDVPRAPDGTYYELWFANDDSIVSGGTFASEFPVTLYIAALRDEYPRMGITIEPRDADPGSSGNVVLKQP